MSEEYERDQIIGAALRELPVPEHRPEFFSGLLTLVDKERREAPALPARRPWFKRPLVPVAAVTAIVAIGVGVLVFPRPNPALAVLKDAEARFAESPPFRAVISAPPAKFRLSYRDQAGWRFEPVLPADHPFAGAYSLWDGNKLYTYTPPSNMYEVKELGGKELNLLGFFIWKADGGIQRWEAQCGAAPGKVLPNEVVAGRDARHVICGDFELWVDAETGLMLKITSHEPLPGGVQPEPRPGNTLEIVEIEYHPTFPEGFFKFSPPPGAKSFAEYQAFLKNPFNWTKLVKGEAAPTWAIPSLTGGSVRLEDLRSKPALILLSDCNEVTAGADLAGCDNLAAFQKAFERRGDRVNFLWVAMAAPGWREEEARQRQLEVVSKLGFTFPAAMDIPFAEKDRVGGISSPRGVVHKAWASDTCGCDAGIYYVLLDSEGRVVDVRIQNQTFDQLDEFLSGAPG